jgi:hypothetical protein
VLVLSVCLGALAGKLASAGALELCANKHGGFAPYEGDQLWFTQTYRTIAEMCCSTTSFWALRRRPDYSIAISVHYVYSKWDYENSVDVNRRSEMGREDPEPSWEQDYSLSQFALGSC